MKRKIVQHGNSTLTLSLPSKWIKENDIKKGQYLNIDILESGLFINPGKIKHSCIEIDINEKKEWYITKILSHIYTYGYEEIKINYLDKKQLQLIRKALSELNGFEIIESTANYCKIKAVTSIDNAEFNEILKGIFWQIKSQFDYFIEDIEKNNYQNYDEAKEIHNVTIRLINLSQRLINKNILFGRVLSKYAYNVLIGLLNISRSISYAYNYSKSNNCEFTKNEIESIKKIKTFYLNLIDAYQNINILKVKDFLDEREKTIENFLEVLKEKNPIPFHFFIDMLKDFSSISNFIILTETNRENALL